ncbi:ATP-dependent helicase [Candidatus Parvarchaeota archaeon]|jgi:DNA helicase-2/ATP-dependent DNA helicase PcrA|nr:ATP-dependent helicase [Candidatus Parvarchaeota archaeon]
MDLTKNILIKANPGTGKTTSLADRVIELIKDGVSENEILCLTFTNKAVDEMFEKISQKLKESNLEISRINGITISTFHSFCNSYFSEQEKEYELVSNNFIRFSIFKSFENNNAFNYDRDYVIQELVPKVENAIRYIKSFGITPDEINIKMTKEELINKSFLENMNSVTVEEILAFLDYFITAFKDYEREKGPTKIDYNDLLKRFLQEYDPLKKHYKYVLVDELQDLNEVEAEIARLLGDYLFLVGDRKQSIFGFQGGSLKNFIEFQKLSNLEQLTKGLNYRSYSEILDYSKRYFLNKTKDKSYEEELSNFKSNKGPGGKVKQLIGNNTDNIAVKLAMDLVSQGKNTAIITRTNEQIIGISRILDSKNIKYATTASASVSTRAKNSVINYLKGIFNADEKDILKALFTPFSGVSLKRAFEIEEKRRKKEINMNDIKGLAKPFFDRKASAELNIFNINKLFNETILPISVALDNDYYISAAAILENINQYIDSTELPNFLDMLVYLYTAEDSYESNDKQENLVLTTVHKAKGLEFENVIYVPKKQSNRMSFIDLVTNSIIKQTKEIDVKEELSEESIRVDFVAFTRAKENLFVVTPAALTEDYYIEGLIEKNITEMEDEPAPFKKKYSEAYSLFVNKEYNAAKTLLEENDKWMVKRINNYFSQLKSISFSLLDAISDPLNFIKTKVLGVSEVTESTKFGLMAHKMAEDYFKHTLKEEELDETQKKILRNIISILEEIKIKYNAVEINAEKTLEIPLQAVFPDIKIDLKVSAKLDAVFFNKEKDKFLIIDFKTDRSDDKGSKHRRQLALYRRLFAIAKNIDEKYIDTAIAYINLTGKINTGKFEYKLDTQKIKDMQIETVKNHILQLLVYKENPERLIEKATEKYYYSDSLNDEIFKKLREEHEHSKAV